MSYIFKIFPRHFEIGIQDKTIKYIKKINISKALMIWRT